MEKAASGRRSIQREPSVQTEVKSIQSGRISVTKPDGKASFASDTSERKSLQSSGSALERRSQQSRTSAGILITRQSQSQTRPKPSGVQIDLPPDEETELTPEEKAHAIRQSIKNLLT